MSICIHMCLRSLIVWFCSASVLVMLFICNVIPVSCVRADVDSCTQQQQLRHSLLCFPYSLLFTSPVISWWWCLEIEIHWSIIKSFSHSSDLIRGSSQMVAALVVLPTAYRTSSHRQKTRNIQSTYTLLSSTSMPTLTMGLLFPPTTAF